MTTKEKITEVSQFVAVFALAIAMIFIIKIIN